MNTPDPVREEKETGRLEAFSDGVFAIAMTLLVLDLKVPRSNGLAADEGLLPALLGLWPSFAAYLTSFATILIMWVNHHNLFSHIKRTNNLFMLANGLLLFFVTFIPFPTSLLAEYFTHPQSRTAGVLYAGTYFLTAIAFNIVWRYASSGHRLIDRTIPLGEIESINRQYVAGPLFYGLATVAAFWSALVSFLITVGLAIFYAITGSLSPERRRK